MLVSAVSAGLCSAGMDVLDLGIAPTPAVSWCVRSKGLGFGVVISASHNPPEDNGIKLFGPDGAKLSQQAEEEIAAGVGSRSAVPPEEIGRVYSASEMLHEYIEWLAGILPEGLEGMRVAVDTANGAAYELAPKLLRRLGAEVVATGADPNGDNINVGVGATAPETIQRLTVESKAHIGVSFDGDADRCVFSDENGDLINGDRAMAILALYLNPKPPIVVGTVMSNLAFEEALQKNGFRLERAAVGDRNVAERMNKLGAKIGGEQSGHIILSDYAPTGDGLLTAVLLLKALKGFGGPASQLPPRFMNRPQILINVRVERKDGWNSSDRIRKAIAHADDAVRGTGRVLVRASGTQPVIRIMVEASDERKRDEVAEELVRAVVEALGGEVNSRVELTHALGD